MERDQNGSCSREDGARNSWGEAQRLWGVNLPLEGRPPRTNRKGAIKNGAKKKGEIGSLFKLGKGKEDM